MVQAALTEDQKNPVHGTARMEWLQLDLYGRRAHVDGAVVGAFSSASLAVATLRHDFSFRVFDANSTLRHGAADMRSTVGPSRNEHGEGHYGLHLVGDASISTCNSSHSCCDGYTPLSSAGGGSVSCELVFS